MCVPGTDGAAQAARGGAAPGVPQVCTTHGPGHGLREARRHGGRPQASLLKQHRRAHRPRVSSIHMASLAYKTNLCTTVKVFIKETFY